MNAFGNITFNQLQDIVDSDFSTFHESMKGREITHGKHRTMEKARTVNEQQKQRAKNLTIQRLESFKVHKKDLYH